MKSPTKILSGEHQDILKVIGALNRECDALEEGKKIDKAFFSDAIDFIRNFADRFHHMKEEDILFKELCRDTVSMHCNPVEQMLHEHDEGRKFVKGMEEGVKKGDREAVIENSRGYANLLQEHIMKEDEILYPMADEALDKKAQTSMLKRFKEAEKRFGEKDKRRYLSVAERFRKRK